MGQPVFGVSDQVWLELAYAARDGLKLQFRMER